MDQQPAEQTPHAVFNLVRTWVEPYKDSLRMNLAMIKQFLIFFFKKVELKIIVSVRVRAGEITDSGRTCI